MGNRQSATVQAPEEPEPDVNELLRSKEKRVSEGTLMRGPPWTLFDVPEVPPIDHSLSCVLRWLDLRSMARCALVCRRWRAIAYRCDRWEELCRLGGVSQGSLTWRDAFVQSLSGFCCCFDGTTEDGGEPRILLAVEDTMIFHNFIGNGSNILIGRGGDQCARLIDDGWYVILRARRGQTLEYKERGRAVTLRLDSLLEFITLSVMFVDMNFSLRGEELTRAYGPSAFRLALESIFHFECDTAFQYFRTKYFSDSGELIGLVSLCAGNYGRWFFVTELYWYSISWVY